jgi:hypothetical protein
MDLQTISILKSALFFFCFFFAPYVCIPKGMKLWEEWKKTGHLMTLSHAITAFAGALFLYVAALMIVIMRFLGLA